MTVSGKEKYVRYTDYEVSGGLVLLNIKGMLHDVPERHQSLALNNMPISPICIPKES